jgi:hypothetical protein
MSVFDNPALERAVAKFLFVASKDEPDSIAGIYRAAALALLKAPLDPDLLSEAEMRKSVDDPLYSRDVIGAAALEDIFASDNRD